jgi:hypothetical protein
MEDRAICAVVLPLGPIIRSAATRMAMGRVWKVSWSRRDYVNCRSLQGR